VVLKRSDPTVLDVCLERTVFVLLDVEPAIAFAVGDRGPAVRVRFHFEVRALDVLVVTHDLHVRRRFPIAAAVVLDLVAQVDAIRAGVERVGLRDGDAVLAPCERHDQLRVAGFQPVLVGSGVIQREMVRLRTLVCRTQTGLRDVARILRAEQAHRQVRAILHLRVLQQIGALEIAAAFADVDREHVGDDAHDASAAFRRFDSLLRCRRGFRLRGCSV
jgi:hypothetical protein